MRELYALLGKKHLALLLGYQFIFFISLLSSFVLYSFDKFYGYSPSQFLHVILFICAYLSLALLIDGLWNALSDTIFRLDYLRAKHWHHNILRPTIFLFVFGLILISCGYQNKLLFCMLIFSAAFIALISFMMLVSVIKHYILHKKMQKKHYLTLASVTEKFGINATKRIQLSLDLANSEVKGNPLPGHRGFSFVNLKSSPWYDGKEFSWIKTLEKNYHFIKAEVMELITNNDKNIRRYNYPGITKGAWDSIILIQDGDQKEACKHCPKTMALLQHVPGNLHFREAMFSILGPGASIKPHRDYSNIYLTYHLGLTVPSECGIIVGGEERTWEEGRSIIFDTSYEHEAWNNSKEPRIVLLVDFFNPNLNEAEQEFFKSTHSV